jgi:5'-nucleotidase
MRILVTNDDGITAPGLALAEKIAAGIAGPDGEVWVVAPDFERSGVSHAISYTSPMRMTQLDERRYTVDGYPADCVLVGLHVILKDKPPDLILSGVNRGHNVAEDVVYSGTAGAAMEGGLSGIRSIALSQFYSAGPGGPRDIWDPARAWGLKAVKAVLEMPFTNRSFYSVNFPAVDPEAIRGITVCPQGIRSDATFEVVPYKAPNGRDFLFLRHKTANSSAPEGTDARLGSEGWVTVTPLRPQLTADDLMDEARTALAKRLG